MLGLSYGLLVLARQAAGREAQPTAGIVDSQSVKTMESGGPRGYDAGKKVNGRKRHVLVDTLGLLLRGIVHPANIQDRDGLASLLTRIRGRLPWLWLLFADGGYQGEIAAAAMSGWHWPSSSAPTKPQVSLSCRVVGWSSASSPGSAAIAASPRASRP